MRDFKLTTVVVIELGVHDGGKTITHLFIIIIIIIIFLDQFSVWKSTIFV